MPYSYLQAYTGQEKYIFVSYDHDDNDLVLPVIARLNELGYRVWFDKKIGLGQDWKKEIAEQISGCTVFLVFVTKHSVRSDFVHNEIGLAEECNKPFLPVLYMDPADLPAVRKLDVGRKQAVKHYEYDKEEDFIAEICKHPQMRYCNSQTDIPEIAVKKPMPEPTPAPVEETAPPAGNTEEDALQRTKERVLRHGKLASSVAAGVGALILMIVTALLLMNYHQDNLTEYAFFNNLPNWIAEMIPNVWQELPKLSDPAYRNPGNLPAIAWLIAVGWLLRTAGRTYQKHVIARRVVILADLLSLAAVSVHVALCARVELAALQGGAQWDTYLHYYFPMENLVAFVVMVLGGYALGYIIDWGVQRILKITLKV